MRRARNFDGSSRGRGHLISEARSWAASHSAPPGLLSPAHGTPKHLTRQAHSHENGSRRLVQGGPGTSAAQEQSLRYSDTWAAAGSSSGVGPRSLAARVESTNGDRRATLSRLHSPPATAGHSTLSLASIRDDVDALDSAIRTEQLLQHGGGDGLLDAPGDDAGEQSLGGSTASGSAVNGGGVESSKGPAAGPSFLVVDRYRALQARLEAAQDARAAAEARAAASERALREERRQFAARFDALVAENAAFQASVMEELDSAAHDINGSQAAGGGTSDRDAAGSGNGDRDVDALRAALASANAQINRLTRELELERHEHAASQARLLALSALAPGKPGSRQGDQAGWDQGRGASRTQPDARRQSQRARAPLDSGSGVLFSSRVATVTAVSAASDSAGNGGDVPRPSRTSALTVIPPVQADGAQHTVRARDSYEPGDTDRALPWHGLSAADFDSSRTGLMARPAAIVPSRRDTAQDTALRSLSAARDTYVSSDSDEGTVFPGLAMDELDDLTS